MSTYPFSKYGLDQTLMGKYATWRKISSDISNAVGSNNN